MSLQNEKWSLSRIFLFLKLHIALEICRPLCVAMTLRMLIISKLPFLQEYHNLRKHEHPSSH